MIVNSDYRLEISLSSCAYAHKPNGDDYKRMSFQKENLSLKEFIDRITRGHSFCHIFKDNRRKNANFLYTYIICIDVDDYKLPMMDVVNGIGTYKPTLAYTTFSNGADGLYSFRLAYCFDSPVKSEFERLYFAICNAISLTDNKDDCGKVKAQLMNGNSLLNVEVYESDIVYSISDFLHEEVSTDMEDNSVFAPAISIEKEHAAWNSAKDIDIRQMIKDLNTDIDDFIIKYGRHARIITESELEYNQSGYCLLDDSYLKLFNRIKWGGEKPKVLRFKDGEMRRKRLYIDGCIIRKIKPEICFAELLYNLVLRRKYYYDNRDGVLSNQLLI